MHFGMYRAAKRGEPDCQDFGFAGITKWAASLHRAAVHARAERLAAARQRTPLGEWRVCWRASSPGWIRLNFRRGKTCHFPEMGEGKMFPSPGSCFAKPAAFRH